MRVRKKIKKFLKNRLKTVYKILQTCYNICINEIYLEDLHMVVDKNADWSGWLVRPKKEWLNPNEQAHLYVVIEDRGPRVLIQLLPQYRPKNLTFPCIESGLKDWYEVIDTDLVKNN